MRRRLAMLLMLTLTGALFVGIHAASAHQCPDPDPDPHQPADPACEETQVYDDWRPNYVPLLDLADRDDANGTGEEQRRDAQRWRDECSDAGEYRQQCFWLYGGSSAKPYGDSDPTGGIPRPNELHAGYAATHCFLAEAAHDCDAHGSTDEFATHDSHGGALYADVCLSPNADSRRCDDGLEDTQAGVTIVDHLDCPTGCFDEYHVARPLDTEYTQEQMEDTATATGYIAEDPKSHLCGYPEHTICP